MLFRIRTVLLFSVVSAYAPLGSEPVSKCEIHSYECPSHYLCVTYDPDSNYGHCICDRFYGFYGPTCEKLSVASLIGGLVCIGSIAFMIKALFSNCLFAYRLHRVGCLQQNAVGRSLFFNALCTFPPLTTTVGFFLCLISVDRQMVFHQYIRIWTYSALLVTFILSTMSISLAWIETVEKTRRREHYHWKYKSILYGTSVFTVLLSLLSFRFSFTAILFVAILFVVSFSYLQATRMVTEALGVMEENGDIIVYQGASDVLLRIKHTTKNMLKYSLFMSVSFLVMHFTITLSTPNYKEQDSLPRYLQGQPFLFMVNIYN
jgi:hypothetical protein